VGGGPVRQRSPPNLDHSGGGVTPEDEQTTSERTGHTARPRRRRADSGMSFIEVLVSIVLLGTTVIGVLAATRATIIGSRIERDHSKAQQWLQSAVGVIERTDFEDCNAVGDGPAIRNAYQAAVDYHPTSNPDGAKPPFGFDGGSIEISIPLVWDGEEFIPFSLQNRCFDDVLLRQQLITVTARNPDGQIVESVDLIKRDRP
jgi:hypothetical protein